MQDELLALFVLYLMGKVWGTVIVMKLFYNRVLEDPKVLIHPVGPLPSWSSTQLALRSYLVGPLPSWSSSLSTQLVLYMMHTEQLLPALD